MTWNASEIRVQDAPYAFTYASWSPVGRYIAWNFLIGNWDQIYERYRLIATFIKQYEMFLPEYIVSSGICCISVMLEHD